MPDRLLDAERDQAVARFVPDRRGSGPVMLGVTGGSRTRSPLSGTWATARRATVAHRSQCPPRESNSHPEGPAPQTGTSACSARRARGRRWSRTPVRSRTHRFQDGCPATQASPSKQMTTAAPSSTSSRWSGPMSGCRTPTSATPGARATGSTRGRTRGGQHPSHGPHGDSRGRASAGWSRSVLSLARPDCRSTSRVGRRPGHGQTTFGAPSRKPCAVELLLQPWPASAGLAQVRDELIDVGRDLGPR